jgi:hypothetical protein
MGFVQIYVKAPAIHGIFKLELSQGLAHLLVYLGLVV